MLSKGRAASMLVAGLIAPALGLGAAPNWLQDMDRAFTDLNYDGVFSYFSGQDVAALRIVHMVVDGEPRERLVQLNGAPREIIRRGNEVTWVLMPGDNLVELSRGVASGPFARAFTRPFDRISAQYVISDLGVGRVAGRWAQRVAVTPTDGDRYGHRLWLDREHRLLLRSELVDRRGARLEVFQFTQIEIGDGVDPSALEPGRHEGALAAVDKQPRGRAAARENTGSRWRAGWIPAGFSMAAAGVRRAGGRSESVNTMMYTDGLAAFSIFVEDAPNSGAAVAVVATRRGATVAVTEFVPGPSGRRAQVTLVGELPESTVRKIARSMYHESKAP